MSDLRYESAASLFRVLSYKARIKLLFLLKDGERPVRDLIESSGLEGGALYHHLNFLVYAGLIRKAKRGVYALTDLGRDIVSLIERIINEYNT